MGQTEMTGSNSVKCYLNFVKISPQNLLDIYTVSQKTSHFVIGPDFVKP